jgi:perosamine synthetase
MVKLEDLCIEHSAKLRDALVKMDRNAQGILFVHDNHRLLGVLTDGDARRSIISGKTINSAITNIYNKNCKYLKHDASTEEIQASLGERIKVIPLVDGDRNIVDYSSIYRLHRTPVLEPLLGGNELEYVTDCIKTNWISSQGKYVTQFENAVREYCKADYVLAVSNGTVALHLSLVALGIGPGDEVIVPDITFGASLNSVLMAGAIPVIVDVDPQTWNICPKLIAKTITAKTKAIMPVHIYGVPCDLQSIQKIAEQHNLLIVEDCAEALGSTINGKHVGTFGDAGTFSFFGNKVITCGEGGAIIFKDKDIFEKSKILRDHGMTPGKRYWHEVMGFNYRLTNLQAAVGCAQFEQLSGFREKRKRILAWYETYLMSSGYFYKQKLEAGYEPSYWLFTVTLNDMATIDRDVLIEKMSKLGVDSRPIFYPMSTLPAFETCPTHLTGNSVAISKRGISLPTSVYLEEQDIKSISEKIISCIAQQLEFKEHDFND